MEPGSPELIEVFVVDDEQVVCEGIRRVLEAERMHVESAHDVAEALAHPSLARCDLLLCDLMLPDRLGIELIRAIRSTRGDLPIVVITGYATTTHNAQALEAGADDFLPKPFDAEELLAVVRGALRRKSRETAAKERRS